MNAELNDRIGRIIARAVVHAISATEKAGYAGAKMRMTSRWGLHHEAHDELVNAQAELRAALGLVGAAIEHLDGETNVPKEAA